MTSRSRSRRWECPRSRANSRAFIASTYSEGERTPAFTTMRPAATFRANEPRKKGRRPEFRRQFRSNLAFDDLCFALERAGFTRRTGKGSHTLFFKVGSKKSSTCSPGSQAKPYQVKQVREFILKYQLEID